MSIKTTTKVTFLFMDSPNSWEYQKESICAALNPFIQLQHDVDLAVYLTDLLAQKAEITAQNVFRIAINHTIFYSERSDTEFSTRIMTLMQELGASFNLVTQRLTEGENLYTMLDKIRQRPAMWIGETSITSLHTFIHGYEMALNDERETQPPFSGFNDFVGRFYGKYTTAGWKNLILNDHNGNEEEALTRFYELLDDYREKPNKPDARKIILRLLHVAMLDFRAENEHERQKQVADLLHHVPTSLQNAIYGGIDIWYDNILQDIFERARGNTYLHHWIKANAPETVYYEQENGLFSIER
jgi:hypothetical protein